MLSLKSLVLGLLTVGSVVALPGSEQSEKRGVAFDWANTKVRGLNIGGWLVLEPWITPSIFEKVDQSLGIVDEYTLTEKLGSDAALKILRPHWDTWCTFADFKKIADSGFNLVRIPIGYWAYQLHGEPYTQGAAVYIDAAVDWARATGLKILIDLHGAPGSQNGFDNSGHKVSNPGWQQGDNVQTTLDILRTISNKYAQPKYQDVVVGIQLLNEPLGPVLDYNRLRQFTYDGYGQVRSVSDTPVIFHDAFRAPSSWNNELTPAQGDQNVIIDHHEYQVFDNSLVALQPWQHRQLVCNNADSWSGSDKWSIIGEWTGAMTDCAKYLNGYKIGARYDGSYPGSSFVGSCAGKSDIGSWNEDFRNDMRGFIEAQLDTYEKRTNGWFWWNFKTEGAGEWDAFALIDAGIFPQPLTARKFGPVCSN